jgi:hypothetical protein
MILMVGMAAPVVGVSNGGGGVMLMRRRRDGGCVILCRVHRWSGVCGCGCVGLDSREGTEQSDGYRN